MALNEQNEIVMEYNEETEKTFETMSIEERVKRYSNPMEWGCECMSEFDWRRDDGCCMINPNVACETCVYIWKNRIMK